MAGPAVTRYNMLLCLEGTNDDPTHRDEAAARRGARAAGRWPRRRGTMRTRGTVAAGRRAGIVEESTTRCDEGGRGGETEAGGTRSLLLDPLVVVPAAPGGPAAPPPAAGCSGERASIMPRRTDSTTGGHSSSPAAAAAACMLVPCGWTGIAACPPMISTGGGAHIVNTSFLRPSERAAAVCSSCRRCLKKMTRAERAQQHHSVSETRPPTTDHEGTADARAPTLSEAREYANVPPSEV